MFSTRQVAKKLGITHATLSRYITAGKIAEPKAVTSGGMTIHLWSEEDIERARDLLPKIKNGRKTRYKKQSAQPRPKHISTQPRAAVPHKQRSTKKKSKP